MDVTLDWLGCATFRLKIGETTIFLDAYMDRVSTAPPVGLTTREITKADFVVVGHSHFDHLSGAEVIAANTGARIIGSNETCRVMASCGIPETQLQRSQGGERWQIADGVTVRVFPSLHSCIWCSPGLDATEPKLGHYGLTQEQRAEVATTMGLGRSIADDVPGEVARERNEHLAANRHNSSNVDGGALAYLFETPVGSIFYQDTSGCWTGVLKNIRPDVALLAAAGRGNIDGEPIQGSLAQFVAREADILRPKSIILNHHDNWFPPLTKAPGTDISPIREELERMVPTAQLLEIGYSAGTVLFRG
jgi:L-ascorbate metabolism protein UlaG (beta-lactamase superfamily)